MAFVRKWQFDGAARILSTTDLEQILDPDSDLGAAIQLVLEGLSVTANLPPGGTTGQSLVKTSDSSGDVEWATLGISDITGLSAALGNAGTLPADGTIGEVLKMASSTPGDYDWALISVAEVVGLTGQLSAKQAQDDDLTTLSGLTHANDTILQTKSNAWAARTPAQFKTDLVLVKGDVGLGNVDNTSDTTKWSATATVTNKVLNGANNTFNQIPMTSVEGLEAAFENLQAGGLPFVVYSGSYPTRASSGNSNPAIPVMWIGGAGPSKSGSGATGAQTGDIWIGDA